MSGRRMSEEEQMRRLSDNLADISLDFERRSSVPRGSASERVESELRRVSDDLGNFQFDAEDLAILQGARASTSGSDALQRVSSGMAFDFDISADDFGVIDENQESDFFTTQYLKDLELLGGGAQHTPGDGSSLKQGVVRRRSSAQPAAPATDRRSSSQPARLHSSVQGGADGNCGPWMLQKKAQRGFIWKERCFYFAGTELCYLDTVTGEQKGSLNISEILEIDRPEGKKLNIRTESGRIYNLWHQDELQIMSFEQALRSKMAQPVAAQNRGTASKPDAKRRMGAPNVIHSLAPDNLNVPVIATTPVPVSTNLDMEWVPTVGGVQKPFRSKVICACCGMEGRYQKSCGTGHKCLKGICGKGGSGTMGGKSLNKQMWMCHYCGKIKESSASVGAKGVKIRCECRGNGKDGMPKMHVKWHFVPPERGETMLAAQQGVVAPDPTQDEFCITIPSDHPSNNALNTGFNTTTEIDFGDIGGL